MTLRLDKKVIDRAKEYAHLHKISLSAMVETYLDSVTRKKSNEIEITPLVESLSGVIKLPVDFDYKKDYTDYLAGKYE